jgi:hypothetical protein
MSAITAAEIRILLFFALSYLVAPIFLIWGWSHWAQQPKARTVPAIFSLTGFVLATVSALLAIWTVIYAQARHLPFYDPSLLTLFRTGALLSLSGMVFGLCGIARKSSLRWHAPTTAMATLAFWVVAIVGESTM